MTPFIISDWYWIVSGDQERVWSSNAALVASSFSAGYLPVSAEQYQAFIAAGGQPTNIGSESDLRGLSIAVVPGLTMLGRLTDAEYAAVRRAESESYETVGRWLDALRVNGEVNLFGTTAESAKAGLVQAGLLTAQRAEVVFASQ